MSLADIDDFIAHWHRAVGEALDDRRDKDEMPALEAHLKGALKKNQPLRRLAVSPLLCAVICALHRDANRYLPEDRIQLYDKCCEMLLERYDAERGIDVRRYPELLLRDKLTLLEDLAYHMMKNDWAVIETEKARTRLAKKLGSIPALKDADAANVLRLFLERSGMLREPVAGRIDFPHRTFQEYLTARAIKDEGDLGAVIQHVADDAWQEVIVLTAGLVKMQERDDLIRGIIGVGDADEKQRHRAYLLAAACLETAKTVGPELQKELNDKLRKIFPPKNMSEAAAAARAGDLAVPFLESSHKYRAREACACVRALSMIGSDAAVEALKEYASDERATVQRELDSILMYLNDEGKAAVLLQSKPKSLRLNRKHESFGFLAKLTFLDHLFIMSQTISDLSPLAGLHALQSIRISSCHSVSDLSPLAGLHALQSLEIIWCHSVSDLSPLAELHSLQSLEIRDCAAVSDLSPLAGMHSLQSLAIWYCAGVTDLSPLAGMHSLQSLTIEYCAGVSDLSPLLKLNENVSISLGIPRDAIMSEELEKRPNVYISYSDYKSRPAKPAPAATVRILHLSDLHFRDASKAALWRSQLAEDLTRELTTRKIDLLILSGDLVFQGSAEGFTGAREFLEMLRSEFDIKQENIVIVPGNHDLVRDVSKKAYSPCRASDYKGPRDEEHVIDNGEYLEVKDPAACKRRFAGFSDFYEAVKGEPYPLDYEAQGLLYHFPDFGLLFLGLNSAWNIDHHFTDRAAINNDALNAAFDTIRNNAEFNACRKLAVFHHPLISPGEDRIKDHGFLERLAVAGFRAVLHGHVHKAENNLFRYDAGASGRKIEVIAAGTFGAPTCKLPTAYPWQYSLLELNGNSLTVHTRKREAEDSACSGSRNRTCTFPLNRRTLCH